MHCYVEVPKVGFWGYPLINCTAVDGGFGPNGTSVAMRCLTVLLDKARISRRCMTSGIAPTRPPETMQEAAMLSRQPHSTGYPLILQDTTASACRPTFSKDCSSKPLDAFQWTKTECPSQPQSDPGTLPRVTEKGPPDGKSVSQAETHKIGRLDHQTGGRTRGQPRLVGCQSGDGNTSLEGEATPYEPCGCFPYGDLDGCPPLLPLKTGLEPHSMRTDSARLDPASLPSFEDAF